MIASHFVIAQNAGAMMVLKANKVVSYPDIYTNRTDPLLKMTRAGGFHLSFTAANKLKHKIVRPQGVILNAE